MASGSWKEEGGSLHGALSYILCLSSLFDASLWAGLAPGFHRLSDLRVVHVIARERERRSHAPSSSPSHAAHAPQNRSKLGHFACKHCFLSKPLRCREGCDFEYNRTVNSDCCTSGPPCPSPGLSWRLTPAVLPPFPDSSCCISSQPPPVLQSSLCWALFIALTTICSCIRLNGVYFSLI